MASPHVAGVAGLLLAQDSSLTVNEIKWRILNGTDKHRTAGADRRQAERQ